VHQKLVVSGFSRNTIWRITGQFLQELSGIVLNAKRNPSYGWR
jgi:hypothetical protein